MDWERLADVGVADVIMTWLDWRDLIALERVSRFLYAQVNTEPVWRRAAQRLFEDKTFVPAFCRRLVTPGNSREHRVDLLALSVRALRLHAAHLGGVDLSECVEKAEMAAAICARELRRSYGPHECLARFAIRVALVDRHRNVPTVAELCSTQWNIRLLTHGPLGQLAPMDPWHLGRPDVGCVDFRPDGTLSVRFPPDANPFAHMGFNAEVLGYEVRAVWGVVSSANERSPVW